MIVGGFEWDEGNWPKCGKHGLSKSLIESVFAGQVFVFDDPFPAEVELRYRAIGRSTAGRYVFVVFTLRERGESVFIRPIAARHMHKAEIEHYERQRKDEES